MSDQLYAGDVTPTETWEALKSDGQAVLVDVRTVAEWRLVGQPNLAEASKAPVNVEWQSMQTGAVNENFAAEVAQAGVGQDQPIYFLCKVGGRSQAAAAFMTQAGYKHCYNIAEGFEGGLDEQGRRGRNTGWKAEGLPWAQP